VSKKLDRFNKDLKYFYILIGLDFWNIPQQGKN